MGRIRISAVAGADADCEKRGETQLGDAAEHAQEGPSKTQSIAAVQIGTGRRHQLSSRRPVPAIRAARHWGRNSYRQLCLARPMTD